MIDFKGKTAVISGGAAGIGLDLAKTLGQRGMNIVITDIEKEPLASAEQELAEAGVPVLTVEMDVALQADWERTATAALKKFGKIHMLVNNAGVGGGFGPIEDLDDAAWRWSLDVNLMGVVYGASTFVPLMKQHGEGGWLINVASMAGMGGAPLGGAYTATKAAVVALTESWAPELKGDNIHVSVLAPAFVKTRIHESHRNRQQRYQSDCPLTDGLRKVAETTSLAVTSGIDVNIVGQRVVEALEAGELYIFTHPNYQPVTEHRAAAVSKAFQNAADSPLLQEIRNQEIPPFIA